MSEGNINGHSGGDSNIPNGDGANKRDTNTVGRNPASLNFLFSAGGIIVVLVILILVNVLISPLNLRWDTTEENLYSLSEGTKKILSELDEPVTIKVFYTKDNVNVPLHIKNFANRVIDFLDEYQIHGKGKISLEIYHPQVDSEEEDWALKYGIEPIRLRSGDKIYLGLVAIAADQEESIKMLDPSRETQLEYDITRMISRIQSPKKPNIGIVSGLPVFGQPPMRMGMQSQGGAPAWVFIDELKKTYTVEEIGTSDKTIDNGLDLLILLHPKNISETLLYAIDQYVLAGGNLIVFVDPLSITDRSPGRDKSSSVDKFFRSWGVEMDKMKVLVDFDSTTKTGGQNNQIEDNPVVLSLRGDAFNRRNIITTKLESVLMPMAGTVKKAPDSSYDYEPLLQSSSNSALTEAFMLQFGSSHLRKNFRATVEKYDLAVRVRGKFKTAFPGGKPKPESKDGKTENNKTIDNDDSTKHLTEASKKSTVIIISDADMLYDDFYVRKQNLFGLNLASVFNDNLNLLLNACEVLTGSENLISIRSRGKFERPFTRVEELEKEAQSRWLAREQELEKKVEETNRKLREFEKKKDPSQRFIMSAEQEAEIQKFRDEKRKINQQLKEVRRNLRADIEALGNTLKFVNIGLMPILIAIAGIVYGFYRRRKSTSGSGRTS